MWKGFVYSILILAIWGCSTNSRTPDTDQASQIDKEGIRKTFFTNRKYISDCYGQALMVKGQEKLKGKLTVQFKIDIDGRAKEISALPEKSTLTSPELQSCIFKGIESWSFPIDPSGIVATVIYPLAFSDAPPKTMQDKMNKFEELKKDSESL